MRAARVWKCEELPEEILVEVHKGSPPEGGFNPLKNEYTKSGYEFITHFSSDSHPNISFIWYVKQKKKPKKGQTNETIH